MFTWLCLKFIREECSLHRPVRGFPGCVVYYKIFRGRLYITKLVKIP